MEVLAVAKTSMGYGRPRPPSKVNKLNVIQVGKWGEVFVFSWAHNIIGNVMRIWSTVSTGD